MHDNGNKESGRGSDESRSSVRHDGGGYMEKVEIVR